MGYAVFEKLCENKGVKPYQVSKETGVSTATLSHWKKGLYTPKTDKLQKIADYFDVTVEYIMTGDESEEYYIDEETAAIAQELLRNKEMRILMKASRGLSPQQMLLGAQMFEEMKKTNPDG